MPEIKKPDKVQVHLVRAYCSRSILNVPSGTERLCGSLPVRLLFPSGALYKANAWICQVNARIRIYFVLCRSRWWLRTVPRLLLFFLNDFRRKDLCSFAVSRQGVNSSGSNSTTSLPFMLRSGFVFQHDLYCRWTCLNTRPDPNSPLIMSIGI